MELSCDEVRRRGGILSIDPTCVDDLFVVCASYEERSLFVADHFSPNYRVQRSIIYVNTEFLSGGKGETRKNLYKLIARLARCSDQVDVVEGSWLSNELQLKVLRDSLSSRQQLARITLDSTTFTRESLLTSLLLIRAYFPDALCRVAYTSPVKHGDWLSKGYRRVRNVLGLSGVQLPSRPTVLMILSGFEAHRTQKIIEDHEPAKVLLGVGNPPTDPAFLERNMVEQKLILARQEVEKFQFSAVDIQECKSQLRGILATYSKTHNIVLAPMSTKFSTIAGLLVTEEFPEVQITYCLPGEYNTAEYSGGSKSLYTEELFQTRSGS